MAALLLRLGHIHASLDKLVQNLMESRGREAAALVLRLVFLFVYLHCQLGVGLA